VVNFLALRFGASCMSHPAESQPVIRFGEFLLDCETAELRRNGDKSSLQGQPVQILTMLVENPGRLVTRDELKKRLWPTDTFVDFDQSLNRAVNRLREALGDSAEKPRYVETLPRRGYRFIGTVSRSRPEAEEAVSSTSESGVPAPQTLCLAESTKKDPDPTVRNIAPDATDHNGRPSRRKFAGLVCLALVAAGGLVAVWHSPVKDIRTGVENLEMTRLTNNGRVDSVAISGDGRYVAYAVRHGEKYSLRMRQVATGSDVEILSPDFGNFVGMTFTVDANYIYFVRAATNDPAFRYLYSVPSLGGTPTKLITDVDSGIAFSPDGRKLVYEHWVPPRKESEIKVAEVDGSNPHVLAVIPNAGFLALGAPGPSWSPDGRTIALSERMASNPGGWVLFSISYPEGRARQLYASLEPLGRPVWQPEGDRLVVPHRGSNSSPMQLWTVSFPKGIARRLTHDASNYDLSFDTTKDGKNGVAITNWAEAQVWAPSPDAKTLKQITPVGTPMFEVRTSLNGRILSRDFEGGLWIMNADGTDKVKLRSPPGTNWFDICGENILLLSDENSSTILSRLDADGTTAKIATGDLWSPTCSQRGEWIYYVNFEQPQKVHRISTSGGAPTEVATLMGDYLAGSPSVSPDGQLYMYAYSTYNDGPPGYHVAVISLPEGKLVRSFDLPGHNFSLGPYWSPDGKGFRYLLVENQISNIWEQRLTGGGPPRPITHFASGEILDFTCSADGHLFITLGSVTSDMVLLTGLR